MKKKILITGAGAPGGPGIIKALKKTGHTLYTCDANPYASGRFLEEPFIEIPKAEDVDFLPFIFNFCIENKIDVVFPLVTKELFPLAEEKEIFSRHNIKVIVSDPASLFIANDKGKLYQHLRDRHIAVPAFEIVATVEQLIAAAEKLGYSEGPVCIKPAVSNGSRGVRIVEKNINDFELLFHHKPDHLHSTLERICKILDGKTFPTLLVSEYLPGREYSIDAIVHEGIPKLILPRERIKMMNGISVQGTFINDKKIIDYCERILQTLNLSGPIGLQVKEDVNGEIKLLEINPRIQGSSVAALGVGINLSALAIQQEFEQIEINTSDIPWGTSFVRYYEEAFYKP